MDACAWYLLLMASAAPIVALDEILRFSRSV